MDQLELFPTEKEKKPLLVCGGIYRDNNDEPDYDGCYALCMGSDQFYFIYDGINHIQEIVEIACSHTMRLVPGYTLAIKKDGNKYKWQIRNSSKKHEKDYIIAEGNAGDGFRESLNPFLKVFHK
jgi:transcriptional antiterminator Rof (Rho-off)